MLGLIGVITVLIVLCLSLVITRLATVALMATGLSEQAARFQARSAFTGTGYTTAEAERVVDHPVRRRIIMWLMILRSAGLVSILISLILSFLGSATDDTKLIRLYVIAGGAVLIWLLAQSRWIDQGMKRAMQWAFDRWTDLDARDYVGLLKLSGVYTVRELMVNEGDWLAGQRLDMCRLPDEGVLVLGIYRSDGSYVGAPNKNTQIESGDTLILYGRGESLADLDKRGAGASGDQAHQRAVHEQQHEVARQDAREERSRKSRARRRAERSGEDPDQLDSHEPQDNARGQPDQRNHRQRQ